MRHALFTALFGLLALCSGCERIAGTRPDGVPRPGSGAAQGGVAQVDLTPIPGYPMGGHAIMAETSVGIWTHLYARTVYLEDADGAPVVLLAADLWAIPAGLVDRLAERLADDPQTRHIGRQHLIVGATHTHHSPANFSSSRIYNRHASNRPGFDPDMLEFIVERMALSVRRAVTERRPVTLRRGAVTVPGVARNRSIEPFLQNPEARAWLEAHRDVPGCGGPEELDVDLCQAVRPELDALVLSAGDEVIGVAAFFAVHATAMPNFAEVYHGDVFGIAAAAAARALTGDDAAPVVALFNGAQGDVSPNWDEQRPADTLAIGQRLGAGIVQAVRGARTNVEGPFRAGFRMSAVAGRQIETASGQGAHASPRALSGRSQLVGAEDGRTQFWELGWREGITQDTPAMAGQGTKVPAVTLATVLYGLPPEFVPREVPLNVAHIGDMTVATLPGEFTTILGARIRDEIQSTTGTGGPVVLAGLAGEYLSYFTTPEEYDLQHYEGASMVYGRDAGTVVQALVGQTATDEGMQAPAEYAYRPGETRRFGLVRDRMLRNQLAPAADRMVSLFDLDAAPSFEFETAVPTWPVGPQVESAVPRVSLDRKHDDGSWAPSGGPEAELETVAVVAAATSDGWTWRAWARTPEDGELRFHVTLPDGGELCSAPLSSGATPAAPCPL